ncbi:EamA domain-containing membrane protein RarD [Monaibacterium marinum]|uniref:EamA domain-containing membrane protein RarD n=1 Tax=Pontivivens marinum TaxID=1690039 RepID=A0A2C9CS26_9RHOB|nr:DMT family transporter [Monaibacterium marinum]SOH94156.1 EamA domain-containing membrane protein RarD [Monaibacterium marinum]
MIFLRGIFLKIASVATFVCMAAIVKSVSDTIPAGQTVFFRSIFAVPVILAWIALQGVGLRAGIATANPMSHLWRGIVGTTAMALTFAGLGLLPLPEVTAIGYAAPLFAVILAAMFLGEQVRLVRLTAVGMGLVGVGIVLSPRLTTLSSDGLTDTETLGAVIVLVSAVFVAMAHVFIRKLVATEKTSSITFWFSITASVLALATIPFGWVMPDPATFGMLVAAGLIGGVGQILLTSAYRYAPTAVIAPFDYASMIFALILGYGLFGEVPTGRTLIGAAIVVAAGLLIIWREQALGLERKGQRKSSTPQG